MRLPVGEETVVAADPGRRSDNLKRRKYSKRSRGRAQPTTPREEIKVEHRRNYGYREPGERKKKAFVTN